MNISGLHLPPQADQGHDQDMSQEMTDILDRQRAALMADLPVSKAVRVDRLNRAIALLLDHKDDFIAALNEDYGGRTEEVTLFADIVPSVQALKYARNHVGKWMKKERRSPTFPLGLLGSRAWVDYKPKGVVGIISPWNFPLGMIFSPLSGALAAGNRVMIKPSEHVPVTSELTRKLFAEYFSPDEVAVFCGGIEVSEAFTRQKFDHIFYTGSGAVGRLVMKAAAENLTPVTLELGGKSPTVILPDCDIADAALRIASAKMVNAGQICVAPDYIFVPRDKLPALKQALLDRAEGLYPEKDGAPVYTSVINARQKQRLEGYLEDARAKGAVVTSTVSYGGDRKDNILPLHVIHDVSDDMTLMQEEIFGPLLPLMAYDTIDEVISYITARPRPLALYILGRGAEGDHIRQQVIAGGVAYDEFLLHVGQEDLPFGGSGASGMGHYHGFEGFRTFSHAMSVFKRGPFDIMGLLQGRPPFGARFQAYIKSELKK
ncbi:MAG: coniferyl aldehyde dehydrogenase [Alphaproteobacteria bacterium]|nr:MAG: coniferyl aldehyde dehydrogenase [Alphaproteobacteria bacterium]